MKYNRTNTDARASHEENLSGWADEENNMKKKDLLLIIVPILLFVILAACIQAEASGHFEDWAYSEAVEHMSPALTSMMKGITRLGNPASVTALCLTLFIVPKWRKTAALPVAAAVISSVAANAILKRIFTRSRPDILQLISESGYSFPSGHATVNAAFYVMLIFLIFHYAQGFWHKLAFSLPCAALPVMIGLSRIYLGVHYAGDVLGGWLLGFATSSLVYFLVKKTLPAPKPPKAQQTD